MKLRSIFNGVILIVALVVFNSCSDDEKSTPKLFFKADGRTISLTDANIYLIDELITGDVISRELMITDGTRTDDGILTNETYAASFSLIISEEAEEAGEFYAVDEDALGDFPDTNLASFWIEDEAVDYQTFADDLESGIIKVTGGFGDDDTLTIEFKNLQLDGLAETTGSFYFKGRVQDQR